MRLVFIYGPPGVGKLTVGMALSGLTDFRLFHNHLTVNLVTSIFPPNTEAWNRLARQIRLEVFTAAAQEEVDLILTRAPRDAGGEEIMRVETMIEPVLRAGGEVVFVQLACAREELLRRVQREERAHRSKLTDPDILLKMFDCEATLPFTPHLRIDTTALAPAETAAQIAARFALPIVAAGERQRDDR